MCPDPQLLSVYLDEELPSPWKEKLENHLTECSSCREKLNSLKQLTNKQLINEQETTAELEMIQAAKDRVWQNLQAGRSFQPVNRPRQSRYLQFPSGLWQRRLAIPLPAAAAAVIIIILAAALLLRGGQINNDGFAQQQLDSADRGFFIAAEDEFPGIMPAANINDVLQFLSPSDTNIIILRLPENTNFSRTGEPAMIRAADYQQMPRIPQEHRRQQ